jgi:hypothetical protein
MVKVSRFRRRKLAHVYLGSSSTGRRTVSEGYFYRLTAGCCVALAGTLSPVCGHLWFFVFQDAELQIEAAWLLAAVLLEGATPTHVTALETAGLLPALVIFFFCRARERELTTVHVVGAAARRQRSASI